MLRLPGRNKLLYFSSDCIVSYIEKHPISWKDRSTGDRGAPGDILTPTPAIEEFLALLHYKSNLFTQKDLCNHCVQAWNYGIGESAPGWFDNLESDQKNGLMARVKTNFYVAMIDTLHVYALLIESGWFDTITIAAFDDVKRKVDLTLRKGDTQTLLALYGPRAKIDRDYKIAKRNNGNAVLPTSVVDVQLPLERDRKTGNKRWYRTEDFYRLCPHFTQQNVVIG